MKNIKITKTLIRKLKLWYDPSEFMPNRERILIKDFIIKYRNSLKSNGDMIWIVCRKEFMEDKEMKLFAVWCTRKALEFIENPDARSVEVCNVIERYINGHATEAELSAARQVIFDNFNTHWALMDTGWAASCIESKSLSDAAQAAAWESALIMANSTHKHIDVDKMAKAVDIQIDKLLTYFE